MRGAGRIFAVDTNPGKFGDNPAAGQDSGQAVGRAEGGQTGAETESRGARDAGEESSRGGKEGQSPPRACWHGRFTALSCVCVCRACAVVEVIRAIKQQSEVIRAISSDHSPLHRADLAVQLGATDCVNPTDSAAPIQEVTAAIAMDGSPQLKDGL